MKNVIPTIGLLVVLAATASAQDRPTRWQRRSDTVQLAMELFHSTQSLNLPTAETLNKGEFHFEISHRFVSSFSRGVGGLFGLDGPVNMRLGLGYAPSNRLLVTLARSNWRDNIDLRLKYKVAEIPSRSLPIMIGFQAGLGWNTGVTGRSDGDSRNFQYYGQLIVNTMIADKLALGVVPSYIINPLIDNDVTETTVSMGTYGHYYLSDLVGLIAEWNLSEATPDFQYNTFAFGFHLETGGHFFKILATNAITLNPSQYLIGSDAKFTAKELRLGFNVTRLLH